MTALHLPRTGRLPAIVFSDSITQNDDPGQLPSHGPGRALDMYGSLAPIEMQMPPALPLRAPVPKADQASASRHTMKRTAATRGTTRSGGTAVPLPAGDQPVDAPRTARAADANDPASSTPMSCTPTVVPTIAQVGHGHGTVVGAPTPVGGGDAGAQVPLGLDQCPFSPSTISPDDSMTLSGRRHRAPPSNMTATTKIVMSERGLADAGAFGNVSSGAATVNMRGVHKILDGELKGSTYTSIPGGSHIIRIAPDTHLTFIDHEGRVIGLSQVRTRHAGYKSTYERYVDQMSTSGIKLSNGVRVRRSSVSNGHSCFDNAV